MYPSPRRDLDTSSFDEMMRQGWVVNSITEFCFVEAIGRLLCVTMDVLTLHGITIIWVV